MATSSEASGGGDHAITIFRGRHDEAVVAVEGATIVAVGPAALERSSPGAISVDVGDGTLVPAFRDGHLHPITGGLQQLGAPIAGASSLEELLSRVADHAHAHPELRWVTGAGYDPALLPGGLGDAGRLDEVVPDRPVLLWASDHHSAWANTAALRRSGFTATRGDPRAGRVVRARDGTPTGALLEQAADEVAAYAPRPTGAQKEAALRAALQEMISCGVVWGLDAAAAPSDVAVYARLAAGDPPCRMALALVADPERWPDQRADFAALRDQAPGGPHTNLAVSTVKFFADGIVEAGTAAMIDPYDDDPCSHGIPNWESSELARAVTAFDGVGFGIHIHAIGDAAVRTALDAIEHAGAVNGPRDRRPVIAHAQVVQPDDLDRFVGLGVIANFQPLWAQRDRVMTELTEPRLGPVRTGWQYPIGALDRRGAHLSFGSDWPVTSLRPLEGVAVAVTRQPRRGHVRGALGAEYGVTVERALAAYTRGVAYQAFEETATGGLQVGQRADLCLLTSDPRSVPAAEIADIAVLGTWSGGRQVFRA